MEGFWSGTRRQETSSGDTMQRAVKVCLGREETKGRRDCKLWTMVEREKTFAVPQGGGKGLRAVRNCRCRDPKSHRNSLLSGWRGKNRAEQR